MSLDELMNILHAPVSYETDETTFTFVRTRPTGRVHRCGCSYAGKNWVPWRWAEGRAVEEWASVPPWHFFPPLKTCAHCKPEKAATQDGEAPSPDKGKVH